MSASSVVFAIEVLVDIGGGDMVGFIQPVEGHVLDGGKLWPSAAGIALEAGPEAGPKTGPKIGKILALVELLEVGGHARAQCRVKPFARPGAYLPVALFALRAHGPP